VYHSASRANFPERQILLLPSGLLPDIAPANLPHGGFFLLHQPDHYDRARIAATQISTVIRPSPFLIEEEITTEHTGEYKRPWHQTFMRQWC
jgi:hypothetical protein